MLATTLREEGVRGLYRGIGPTMCGILPYAGLKFYVYQTLKQRYRRCAQACCSSPYVFGDAHRSTGLKEKGTHTLLASTCGKVTTADSG